MVFYILTSIATVFSLTGNYFVNRRNYIGFFIWIIGNFIWISTAFMTNPINWLSIIMFSCYSIFNIEGIIKWRKK